MLVRRGQRLTSEREEGDLQLPIRSDTVAKTAAVIVTASASSGHAIHKDYQSSTIITSK